MTLLDWTERKIDASIITVGESFKTWFQEVWRLFFRVVVFWLSILLGFLHKPSFEKWLAEQRGRIHAPLKRSGSLQSLHSNRTAPFGPSTIVSPRSFVSSTNEFDFTQSSHASSSHQRGPKDVESDRVGRYHSAYSHDEESGIVPKSKGRARIPSRGRSRRRGPRTTFADLLDDEMDDNIDEEHNKRRQSKPESLDDDTRSNEKNLAFSASSAEDRDSKSHPLLSNTRTPKKNGLEYVDHGISGYDDSETQLDGENIDNVSDIDYDEFYGHQSTPSLQTSSSNHTHKNSSHKNKSNPRNVKHERKESTSSSAKDRLFSIEDIEVNTSPLLIDHGPEYEYESKDHVFTPPNELVDHSTENNDINHLHHQNSQASSDIGNNDISHLDHHNSQASSDIGTLDTPRSDTASDSHHDEIGLQQVFSVPDFLHRPKLTSPNTMIPTSTLDSNSTSFKNHRSRSMSPNRRHSIISKSADAGRSNSSILSRRRPIVFARGGTGHKGSSNKSISASHSSRLLSSTQRKQRYDTIDIHKDRIFTSEKLTTGAIEDLRMIVLLQIDTLTNFFRKCFKNVFSALRSFSINLVITWLTQTLYNFIFSPSSILVSIGNWSKTLALLLWKCTFGLLIVVLYWPSRIIGGMKSAHVDKRDTKALVTSQGYPYESHEVITDDGYILKIERLPRRASKKVLYFQHGVVDNSFAWFGHIEGESASALAFRAYDRGYDIFVGTFRGCEGSTNHVKKDITASEYWNFSVNEHGMYDLKAFIEKIVMLKKAELGEEYEPNVTCFEDKTTDSSESSQNQSSSPQSSTSTKNCHENKFDITIVAHSMGAMASLIYLVWSKITKKAHNISAAILLSPAGCHKTAPAIVNYAGPLINLALWLFPWIHTLRFPGDFVRLLVAKVIEDVNNSFTGRTMISWGVAKVIGGSIDDHTFVNMRNLMYNIFSGTSTGVFRHFWQIWKNQRFEGFDYGAEKNRIIYGSETPVNFMENYGALDLPIYFVMGLDDTLIEPVSVLTQYASYKDQHPDLAFLKAFPRMGHIDFTIGATESLIGWILETLVKLGRKERGTDDGVGV